MKELSLNILDITKNSVKAEAKNISIALAESENGILTLTITDDGCGMSEDVLKRVSDPFCTSRTTRKVGLGIPLLKQASEQTGGRVDIESTLGLGTTVSATFDMHHIDYTPLGDIISTMTTLIMGSPEIDFVFTHQMSGGEVRLDTKELRQVLGDVPISSPEVIEWIRGFLTEQYNHIGGQ